MSQMKFITGLLILLFSAAWVSIAHAHQDDEVATVSKEKVVFDEETATGGTKQIGGRKMSPVVKASTPEKVKVASAVVEPTSFSSIRSHKFAGNCEGEEMSNEKHCKKDVSHNIYEDVDDKGFVAFNADYHAPRHHPPKNN